MLALTGEITCACVYRSVESTWDVLNCNFGYQHVYLFVCMPIFFGECCLVLLMHTLLPITASTVGSKTAADNVIVLIRCRFGVKVKVLLITKCLAPSSNPGFSCVAPQEKEFPGPRSQARLKSLIPEPVSIGMSPSGEELWTTGETTSDIL